jgi:hypothetical protein
MLPPVRYASFCVLALIAALLAFAADFDVTGSWTFDVSTSMGSGTPKFVFKQDGGKLGGSYTGLIGKGTLTGTVAGDKINFEVRVSTSDGEVVLKYQGTIESPTTMKGTADYPQVGEATWTAKKD